MKTLTCRLLRFNLILCFLFCLGGTALSQSESIRPQNVKIASPNAAALGKVADMPISYHSGTPNVDLPIYTVQEGPLQMPISLSYHASGLKVMEQSSWVGAGWSLNAGGMITRSVRGMPDEVLSSSGSPTQISYYNNKGYYDYLFMENPTEYVPQIIPNAPSGNKQIIASYEFAHGRRDGEADMFNFNFNGYSGKFYFRPDNSVVLAPQQDIKVTPLFCSSGNPNCSQTNEYLYGWIVTTPDGVKYYFGRDLTVAGNYNSTDNAVPLEYTTSYSATSGLSYPKTVSSWFLSKIESPDKKFSISLTYHAEDYAYYTTSLSPKESYTSALESTDLIKNIIKGVRLTTINFSNNGQVTFVPSFVRKDVSGPNTNLYDFDADSTDANAPRRLGEIRISNSAPATFCQSFVLTYGYFNDTSHPLTGYVANQGNQFNVHSDKKRLKLNAVTERSCDGSVFKPPHSFTYFDEASVPRTLSFAQDHWGYYNGCTSNPSMLPPISIDNGLTNLPGGPGNGNRDSKWPEMRAGSLQKIQYPTGGYTRFVFESHNVYIPVSFYDSTELGDLSAVNGNLVGPVHFTLDQTYTIKARETIEYYPTGTGYIHIINTSTNVDYGFGVSKGLKTFQLPAGDYTFSIQSNTSGIYPVRCKLYKMRPSGYQQLQSVPVGGLRIDSIFYNNGIDNNQKTQTFDYVDENGVDQGILFSRPAYVSLMKNYTIKEHGGIPSGVQYQNGYFSAVNGCFAGEGEPSSPTNFLFFVSANAILPLVTSQGNHFGYNYVKVTESDGGYTVYKFKLSANPSSDVCVRVINHKDCNDFLPNYPPAPEPFKPDRGELASKSVYNSSNVLLYKEVYTNDYQYEQVGVRGLATKAIPYSGGEEDAPGGPAIATTEYEWKSAKKIKSTTEAYTYDASSPGSTPLYKKTEVFFGSIRHTQPTRTVVSDETGKVLSEMRNTFIADLVLPASSCPDLEIGLHNIDSTLNATLVSRLSMYNTSSCAPNDSPCKLEKWLKYSYYANLDRKASVNDRITLINNYKACMKGTTANWSWSSSSPEMKAIVKLKNRNQLHSIVESSHWREGKFLSSESVTYQDFGNDSLSYFPGKLDIISVASPLSAGSFTPVALTTAIVTRDNKYANEETYSYANGNVVEAVAKNGVVTAYIWGYNNTLPIVKAIGVSYATLKSAYDAVSGNLSTLRSQSSLTKAQISTYTYDPLVGMTSATDANNVTTYYSYDEFNRLKSIKDHNGHIVKNYQYHYQLR